MQVNPVPSQFVFEEIGDKKPTELMNTTLIVIVILLSIALAVMLFKGHRPQLALATTPGANPPEEEAYRRDTFAHQLPRWAMFIMIWFGLVGGLIFAIASQLLSKWFVMGPTLYAFCILVALLVTYTIVTRSKESEDPTNPAKTILTHPWLDPFIMRSGAGTIVGTCPEVSGRDEDGRRLARLNWFFGKTNAKYFWERIEYVDDLSRDIVITHADITGSNSIAVSYETADKRQLLIQWSVSTLPLAGYLQNRFQTGGRDADKPSEVSGRNNREQSIVQQLKGNLSQSLSTVIRRINTAELDANAEETLDQLIYREWTEVYGNLDHYFEEALGTHTTLFSIADVSFNTEAQSRMEQTANAHEDNRAESIVLRALGVTYDTSLWNTDILNGEGLPTGVKWRGPTNAEMNWAKDSNKEMLGKVVRTINEHRITGIDGDTMQVIITALMAKLLKKKLLKKDE